MDIKDVPPAELLHLASIDEEAAAELTRRRQASRSLQPSGPREMKATKQNPVPIRTPRSATVAGHADEHPEDFPYEKLEPGEDPFANRPRFKHGPWHQEHLDQGQDVEPLYAVEHYGAVDVIHQAERTVRQARAMLGGDAYGPVASDFDDLDDDEHSYSVEDERAHRGCHMEDGRLVDCPSPHYHQLLERGEPWDAGGNPIRRGALERNARGHQVTDHEFRPYVDNPDYCVAERSDNGDTCNRHISEHTHMPKGGL